MKLYPQNNIDKDQMKANPDSGERFHVCVSCLIDMLFKIRASDWPNLPVDFSAARFGALHVIKVLCAGATYD